MGSLKKKSIYQAKDYANLVNHDSLIKTDIPIPFVSRIFLNDPENNNRLSNTLRAQVLNQLMVNDQDTDIRVSILCGEGLVILYTALDFMLTNDI